MTVSHDNCDKDYVVMLFTEDHAAILHKLKPMRQDKGK